MIVLFKAKCALKKLSGNIADRRTHAHTRVDVHTVVFSQGALRTVPLILLRMLIQ